MIPSLVVNEIQSALVEFLSSTFALTDDEARDALSSFLEDNAEGIFRGPYLRVRTPFRSVSKDSWVSPLDWLPEWFVPYIHQAQAFERLSSARGHNPEPTIVTTGTGSGKTECFLMPMLDHCARMRDAKHDGIKALILYPMNALASDQAGRIADLIATEPRLAGLRAGIYVGDEGRHSKMTPENLIDKRDALRANPPDILLTNYKMLDFLLLRPDDRDLWAVNSSRTLQYLVLDEFHTYDGAQGTDVAMLMRRLGKALGMSAPGRPLGDATPVATSATLGSGPIALAELREFAGKVFGAEFDVDSVIGESRETPQEACKTPDFSLEIPEAEDIAGVDDLEVVANAFCYPGDERFNGDWVELGDKLLAHTLTHGVLSAVADGSKAWPDAVAEIVARAPSWGKTMMTSPETVEAALAQFVRLLSVARRREHGRERPLFSIEVQLWIREVTRLLRSVSTTPQFRWRDSQQSERDSGDDGHVSDSIELPSIYCRRCGASGWMTLQSEATGALNTNATEIGRASMGRSPLTRAMLLANEDDPEANWFDPVSMTIEPTRTPDSIAVHVSLEGEDAQRSTCPSCGEHRAIRFLGTAVASLASVTINTLFGSENLEDKERKLLAFTDSVQDASHRASFFGGRTHRINLRSMMSRIIQADEQIALADLGARLYDEAATLRQRFGLIPPDLSRHPKVRTVWTDSPDPAGVDLLISRLGFEADLEFGMRARVGRTLELSQAAVASVAIEDFDQIVELIREDIEAQTGARLALDEVGVYVRGLIERLRLRGGLLHPLLNPYLDDNGNSWQIWGGRPDGLPPFTNNQGHPSFFATAGKTSFDSVAALTKVPSWLVDWGIRSLGVDPSTAKDINTRALAILSRESDTVVEHTSRHGGVYGIDRRFVIVSDLPSDDELSETMVRCSMCGHLHVQTAERLAEWLDTPCLRYRCGGRFVLASDRYQSYYRKLYRKGSTTRVVTGEHTGLLGRADREDLEKAFKSGLAANAPNVITATPTLEMGIDIGDLSAVMLTSVPRNPASYIQRVGRSGRLTGNSLVTTFVRADTHSLYYLSEPEAMLAGEVRSPNCYLDAVETLERQLIAYLIDRSADGSITGPELPNKAVDLWKQDLPPESFLGTIVGAGEQESHHVEAFISAFDDQIADDTIARLRSFASSGMRDLVGRATNEFLQDVEDLRKRIQRMADLIDKVESAAASAGDRAEVADLLGQRKQLQRLLSDLRREYSLSSMGRLGILPSYNLGDDTVNLVASMWSRDDEGKIETETAEVARTARIAITELAPGNTFYASGHRHRIDAVKIGTADAPLSEDWRICPDCDYVERIGDEAPKHCPRCTAMGFADTGAQFKMLRLTEVYASSSEEAARVFDEADDRERQQYDRIVLVDGDPTTITAAWRLKDKVFGAELVGRADIRTLNLGVSAESGEPRHIGGKEFKVSGFTICSHCGGVEEGRDDHKGERPERLHQGWCRVRSGSVAASSSSHVLFHELTTEAIRMLLPISMFEIDHRLVSFKAALLVGLREDFGGNPDHLEVIMSDAPNREGSGRRRFLVLFDRVPGGTGYLGRLSDPDRMKSILEKARNSIARCPCAGEGRQACHRCLLGVVQRNEYEYARRDLALELLDEQLLSWETEEVDTISNLEIGQVEESELERRFRASLQKYAEIRPDLLQFRAIKPKNPPHQSFELTFTTPENDVVARYRIDEQEAFGILSVQPDFVFSRLDQPGTDVAVFCDGLEYHASSRYNRIAVDAEKRRGIRDDGKYVWNLSWDDVEAFHKAMVSSPPREPKLRPLLTGAARKTAMTVQRRTHPEGFLCDALDQNPMALLLDYLSRPYLDEWRGLAESAVGGIAQAGARGLVDAEQLAELLPRTVLGEAPPQTQPNNEPIAFVGHHVTDADLGLTAVLDNRAGRANENRWTVIAALADDEKTVAEDPAHKARWNDWLQWANVLQFLHGSGQDIIISGVSGASTTEVDTLTILAVAENYEPGIDPDLQTAGAPDASSVDRPTVPLSAYMKEELDLLEDDGVRALLEQALAAGAPDFTAGVDQLGVNLEAGWKDLKIGVTPVGVESSSSDGWIVRNVDAWTLDDLLSTIEGRA